MQVTGKVKLVNEEQTFGEKGFRKRELVVVTDEQYPQTICVEFVQDKCDLLNPIVVGQDVVVSINLRGREWVNPEGVTKYFPSIQGWKIETPAAVASSPSTTSSKEPDDLPF